MCLQLFKYATLFAIVLEVSFYCIQYCTEELSFENVCVQSCVGDRMYSGVVR